ncbi:TRAP transporter small permease [Afifella pfennigii]|uniref:TRAP transporter small permease n=1 Tax=Afifella pfennigii TaxID=209897 RepID=UPI00047CC0EB|nr:TRAP transporter small permease [Afifella pfennigii]
MALLRRLFDLSEVALAAICVVMLAVMVALGIATVFFRFVLESSLAFPEELIRYLFVWMIFLGAAIALRRGAHAAIGVFVSHLPRPFQYAALYLAAAVSAGFFMVLFVKGIALSRRVVPQISPALEVSMAWVYAAVPVGAAFMLLYTLESFLKQRRMTVAELERAGS